MHLSALLRIDGILALHQYGEYLEIGLDVCQLGPNVNNPPTCAELLPPCLVIINPRDELSDEGRVIVCGFAEKRPII
jgi:hypothetical protein